MEAARLPLHTRACECFMRLRRASFSKPPPLGEVARLAVTEGVRLIHPTDCKDNRRIFRGGRCRKGRQSDRAVALSALPLLLRFYGSPVSPCPAKTARFGQNPFPFSPFCRHAGFFFLLFPAPILSAFCILPLLVSCFCAVFFPCGSVVLLFFISLYSLYTYSSNTVDFFIQNRYNKECTRGELRAKNAPAARNAKYRNIMENGYATETMVP